MAFVAVWPPPRIATAPAHRLTKPFVRNIPNTKDGTVIVTAKPRCNRSLL